MVRAMPAHLFNRWLVYDSLDPFGEERADYRTASIRQDLWNIARDPKKHPDGWPLTHFVLPFGDSPVAVEAEKPAQTAEYIEHQIDAWIFVNNEIQKNKLAVEHTN